jgi:hypothetical protein
MLLPSYFSSKSRLVSGTTQPIDHWRIVSREYDHFERTNYSGNAHLSSIVRETVVCNLFLSVQCNVLFVCGIIILVSFSITLGNPFLRNEIARDSLRQDLTNSWKDDRNQVRSITPQSGRTDWLSVRGSDFDSAYSTLVERQSGSLYRLLLQSPTMPDVRPFISVTAVMELFVRLGLQWVWLAEPILPFELLSRCIDLSSLTLCSAQWM